MGIGGDIEWGLGGGNVFQFKKKEQLTAGSLPAEETVKEVRSSVKVIVIEKVNLR